MIDLEVKKWGNSLGIIIPRDIVRKHDIREKNIVSISIVKTADLKDAFGLLKKKPTSAQKFKDFVREGSL